jgi:AraC family transcriptional regulator of adaptative response/methylated-DNA-[protein]-cysteine methyltransferase
MAGPPWIRRFESTENRRREAVSEMGWTETHRRWQALQDIAPGRTASYSEIAERIGAPGAVRAVAQACGANPIAVAIPCHRVVRRDGALSGYRWGVERKRALLQRESAA